MMMMMMMMMINAGTIRKQGKSGGLDHPGLKVGTVSFTVLLHYSRIIMLTNPQKLQENVLW